MKYISSAEAAKQWDITNRQVQRLAASGRIPGAVKFGGLWMIPTSAGKPVQPVRHSRQSPDRPFFTFERQCPILPMCSIYSVSGSADAVLESLAYDEEAYTLFRVGLIYLRGDIDGAIELFGTLPTDGARPDLYIAIAFLRAVFAMYKSNLSEWLAARRMVQEMECRTDSERIQREFWLGTFDIGLHDISKLPDWFRNGELDGLPQDCIPVAYYYYTKYKALERGNADYILLLKPLVSSCHASGALLAEIYILFVI